MSSSSTASSLTNPAPKAAADGPTKPSSPLSSVENLTKMETAERAAVALAARFDDTKKGVNTAACRFAYEQGSALTGVTDIRGLFKEAWTLLPPAARKEVLALLPQFDVQVDSETGERINVDLSLFSAVPFLHSVDVYQDYLINDLAKLILADSRVPAHRDNDDEHAVPPLIPYGPVAPDLGKPYIHDLCMVRALNGDIDQTFEEHNDGWLARVYGEDEGDHADDWKDKNFEAYWGEIQQRKSPGRSDKAGDTALVTLDDLIAAGDIVVGDLLIYEKVFVKPEELKVIFKVHITDATPKKTLRGDVLEHRVNGELIFPVFDDDADDAKKPRTSKTTPTAISFLGVNALETLAFQRSLGGKKGTKPNGNAWRSIKRVRDQDEVKLFQLRVQYAQTHADEIERRAEAKAASVAKRGGAAKGKGKENDALASASASTATEEPAAKQPARAARMTKAKAAKATEPKSDSEPETEAPTPARKPTRRGPRTMVDDEGDHADDWKDKNFEAYWGEIQQRKSPGRSDKAGDTALVTLDDLIAAGDIVVGDLLIYEKVFVKPEELKVIFKVHITDATPKKTLRGDVLEHRVNGELIFPVFDDDADDAKKPRTSKTTPTAISFLGVNALETLAFQRSLGGKKGTKPNGNAWRSIKRVRDQDEVKLFQLRVQYAQTHADEIERRAEAKAASVAKRGRARIGLRLRRTTRWRRRCGSTVF
ncbi:hypothetical protein AMAG_17580 [Allomyces macrogynus ATCC 38327]|uniref:ASX DEUBAD domain-containing protein n=1 Tax=Allomyces macrogynus (strain ATCC 38327) TaxID=578462 RepID=A0A0L0TF66_ALLM3|nr:hypothetical protein AMAG_17580 [Allomyces macrogynus ATCC 38327]|eukprot:KNE73397.1 hypothetical protein AMAG_17580 [Allomyces macrogynus ATCC 38327]